MTFEELKKRCEGRCFDQIVVVVKDVFQAMAELQRIKGVAPGDMRVCTGSLTMDGKGLAYTQRQASYFYENTELCVVEPVEGDTLYRRYLDRFGEGICCVRERVSPQMLQETEKRLRDKGVKLPQRMTAEHAQAVWADLTDELGILYAAIAGDREEPARVIPEKLMQVNITTPDVRDTIGKLADLLEIGPWEVGMQCNRTAHDTAFWTNGALRDVEFEFLLAIIPCGNLEWEVIQPVKGPLVYFDFIERRGVGFHHVLHEIPRAEFQSVKDNYAAKGIRMTSMGSIGPIDWCYMDTENELHYYSELRTDAVMDRLPDGYFAYFYPEPDADK